MAETIEIGCDGSAKWHWYNVKNDLVQRGNLDEKDVTINPFTVTRRGCGGEFLGQVFSITWIKDTLLFLSMAEFSQDLVDAFSAVIEYEPFARYDRDGYTTVEWDKIDPEKSWRELQGERGLCLLPPTQRSRK